MGKMKELKITIDKIVLTITVILAVIWLILTIMIYTDLTRLKKENEKLQIEIEQKKRRYKLFG